MQLPLEYDEGHKTNGDKYGAEAQVGKEMAREITWARQGEQDEDRAQPWKRAWPPASQVEPQSEVVPAGPGAQGQAAGGCLSLPSSPFVLSHGHSVCTKHSGSQIMSLKQVPSFSLFYR